MPCKEPQDETDSEITPRNEINTPEVVINDQSEEEQAKENTKPKTPSGVATRSKSQKSNTDDEATK